MTSIIGHHVVTYNGYTIHKCAAKLPQKWTELLCIYFVQIPIFYPFWLKVIMRLSQTKVVPPQTKMGKLRKQIQNDYCKYVNFLRQSFSKVTGCIYIQKHNIPIHM